MTTFFKCLYGSCLYGTETSESDYDTRSVVYPTFQQLLGLGSEKNTHRSDGMNDDGSFPLRHFVSLLVRGTPNVTEMLFSDDSAWVIYDNAWHDFYPEARKRLVSRKTAKAFLGYAQNNAAWKDKSVGKAQSGKIRVLRQAQQLCICGQFSYPVEYDVKLLWHNPLAPEDFDSLFAQELNVAKLLLKNTALRELPDTEWANEWLVCTLLDYLNSVSKELRNE